MSSVLFLMDPMDSMPIGKLTFCFLGTVGVRLIDLLSHPHQIRFHLEGIHLIQFPLEGNHLSQLHLCLEGDQFHQILDLGLCSGVRHNDHIHHIHT